MQHASFVRCSFLKQIIKTAILATDISVEGKKLKAAECKMAQHSKIKW